MLIEAAGGQELDPNEVKASIPVHACMFKI